MEHNERSSVKQDPVIDKILSKMPENIANTFTDDQLTAMKTVFGARKWAKHPVDIRGVISIWSFRYYYVVLAGKEKRQLTRKQQDTALFIKAVFLFAFLIFSVITGLLILYLIKSAAGIDLIPGYSTGIWSWFQDKF